MFSLFFIVPLKCMNFLEQVKRDSEVFKNLKSEKDKKNLTHR